MAWPGYIADVGNGDPITATHDNDVRDRALQVFTDATARDAALTSPKVGQLAFLTSTGVMTQFVGAVDKWTLPWGVPWGFQGNEVVSTTLSQPTISTIVDVTGMSITATFVANRRLRATWRSLIAATVATDRCAVQLTDGAGTLKGSGILVPSTTANVIIAGETTFASVAGSQTYKLRAQRLTGTGTFTLTGSATDPAVLTIEDMGPAGNPS